MRQPDRLVVFVLFAAVTFAAFDAWLWASGQLDLTQYWPGMYELIFVFIAVGVRRINRAKVQAAPRRTAVTLRKV